MALIDKIFGRNRTLTEHPAYAAVIAHFKAKIAGNRNAAATSETTARGIADVIDAGAPDLYVQIDETARGMIATRLAQTPAQWEAALLQGLDVDAKVDA